MTDGCAITGRGFCVTVSGKAPRPFPQLTP